MKGIRIPAFFFLLTIISCDQNKRTEKGFIVFDDPSYWYFVPSKDLSEEGCVNSFASGNFGRATQFHPRFNGSSVVREALDTLRIDSIEMEATNSLKFLKIAPVELEYEIEGNKIEKESKYLFSRKVEGIKIQFAFNVLPIQIQRVTPLYCYGRKKSDVIVCNCEKSSDEPNDYLFKICRYLKAKGDLSSQPCKYKVNEVKETSLDGKKVLAVYLNCCYTGDVAYFDQQTKELVSFSYGPE